MSGFHRLILRECLETRDNLLCVLGRGLGLDTLLSLFVRLYSSSTSVAAAEVAGGVGGGLVFFLNLDKDEAAVFVERAARQGVEKLPQVVAGESQQERAKMYARGGVVFINAQILVVDLLRGVVPFAMCSGVLVYNAHFIEEHGTLWFALRLLRHHCGAPLFVKGFTCRVEQLQSGSKCEKAMRGLMAKKLYLWPRFEARVQEELNAHQPEVVELFVPLSEKMAAIYSALQRLTVALVQEVCRAQAALDVPRPTLANAFSENWSSLINGQLSYDRQVGPKTRQLLADLTVMRKLCNALLHYDCVLYNRFLETIRLEKTGKNASDWFFHEAADVLFQTAKARVVAEGVGPDGVAASAVMLEPLPKWSTLREILAEIRGEEEAASNVLVVTSDERSARQVAGVLSRGDTGWLLEQWTTSIDRGMYRARSAPSGGMRRSASSLGTGKASRKKKPKRAASAGAVASTKSIAELFQGKKPQVGAMPVPPPPPSAQAASRRDQFEKQFAVLDHGIVVHALDSGVEAATLLERLRPTYVVMYDTNLAFLRSLECYKGTAQGQARPMRVYLMAYDVESEDSRELESENEAFERVIQIKASMLIEEERGAVTRGVPFGDSDVVSSRIGGAATSAAAAAPYIVVDTREFMGSKIPAKLWLRGFDIVPLMLEIGDYVVADSVVIERKTISDLISSFVDGRLFKQCTNMQTHYAVFILLIEFNGGPFMLQSRSELLPQVVPNALSSKLALLVLHFPRLRIFWSRDTSQSEAFILTLRKATRNSAGPDLERIAKSAVTSLRQLNDGIVDATPRIILSKFPGVLAGTADAVAQRGKTLRRLMQTWSVEEYTPLMGKENAAALDAFLTQKYANDEA
jgi:DNA excision repair protein ERCC-4